jgi:hypothetical protein
MTAKARRWARRRRAATEAIVPGDGRDVPFTCGYRRGEHDFVAQRAGCDCAPRHGRRRRARGGRQQLRGNRRL